MKVLEFCQICRLDNILETLLYEIVCASSAVPTLTIVLMAITTDMWLQATEPGDQMALYYGSLQLMGGGCWIAVTQVQGMRRAQMTYGGPGPGVEGGEQQIKWP